jgi:hypothetical protein
MAIADPPAADHAAPLLEKMTPLARDLVQQLRLLIKEVVPQVGEKVLLGWEVIVFSADGRMGNMVAALAPRPTYVNVQFGDGASLPDPNHRLEGTGKRMRHVKVRSAADVRSPDLRALLQASARLNGLQPR